MKYHAVIVRFEGGVLSQAGWFVSGFRQAPGVQEPAAAPERPPQNPVLEVLHGECLRMLSLVARDRRKSLSFFLLAQQAVL